MYDIYLYNSCFDCISSFHFCFPMRLQGQQFSDIYQLLNNTDNKDSNGLKLNVLFLHSVDFLCCIV